MPTKKGTGGLVWSSDRAASKDAGAPRDRSLGGGAPAIAAQGAHAGPYPPPEKQTARLMRSLKGRGGKAVIVVEGLLLPPEGYRQLQRELSQALGTGGTVKAQVIEIQGDMRERVADALTQRGYRIKLVGG